MHRQSKLELWMTAIFCNSESSWYIVYKFLEGKNLLNIFQENLFPWMN